jgi:HSP20 family molecular chaperone IbpA
MINKDMEVQKPGTLSKEGTRNLEYSQTPAIDIFETDDGLTLLADVPGLAKDDLEINFDQGVLTLEGKASHVQSGEKLFREFSVTGYYRQFRIPESIDPDKTSAELKDGVLTLQLHKAEAAKPKRIEVKTIH